MKEEEGVRLTEFDYQTADPGLQMMKAAIPYMQPPQQRILSLMVRMQELRRTMDMFNGKEIAAMGLRPSGSPVSSPAELLQAIKPYAGPRERDMIEMFENIQIMMQAMQSPGQS